VNAKKEEAMATTLKTGRWRETRLALVIAALAAVACRESEGPPTAPVPARSGQLSLVSGDNQEGVPGNELANPFTVKVADQLGAVGGVRVNWKVESGEGQLLPSATTWTDGSGLTQVRFIPGTHRAIVSAAVDGASGSSVRFQTVPRTVAVYTRVPPPSGCPLGDCERFVFYADSTFALQYPQGLAYQGSYRFSYRFQNSVGLSLTFAQFGYASAVLWGDSLLVEYPDNMSLIGFEGVYRLDDRGPPTWGYRISVVSGDDQQGQADAMLEVRVTDTRGQGVNGQLVNWRVTSGSGAMVYPQTVSGPDGRTRSYLSPTDLGPILVAAELGGGIGEPAKFHASVACWATVATIVLWRDQWGMDDGFYLGPIYGPATVKLGTLVEWQNANQVPDYTAHIRSTAVPPGGAAFDSGVLQGAENFRFVPNVEGTWAYVDSVSGVTGRLIVAGLVPEGRWCP
jgi:hypothetical protein